MEAITTVIYYSSNKEDVVFESRVQAKLWKLVDAMNIPLISVTQKPVRFGHNICVGDIGVNERNVWEQMLTGCMAAKTPYVSFCEADTLYPPEYLWYTPHDLNTRYWFEDVWILFRNKDAFYLKGRSDCAHMAGREYIIGLLQKGLAFSEGSVFEGTPRPLKVQLPFGIINIKTGNGMRPTTQTNQVPIIELPGWGTAADLRKEMDLCK